MITLFDTLSLGSFEPRNKVLTLKSKTKGREMKLYYVEPGKTAVSIITKSVEVARYIAREMGLVEVNWSVWNAFRLTHESKALVL